MTFRHDPGPCIICGAAHTSCTVDHGPVFTVEETPQRDAALPLEAERVQATLPPGSFTTATYRRPTARHRTTTTQG